MGHTGSRPTRRRIATSPSSLRSISPARREPQRRHVSRSQSQHEKVQDSRRHHTSSPIVVATGRSRHTHSRSAARTLAAGVAATTLASQANLVGAVWLAAATSPVSSSSTSSMSLSDGIACVLPCHHWRHRHSISSGNIASVIVPGLAPCGHCSHDAIKTLSSRSTQARLRLRPSRGVPVMSSMSSNTSALTSAHSTSVLGAVASGNFCEDE